MDTRSKDKPAGVAGERQAKTDGRDSAPCGAGQETLRPADGLLAAALVIAVFLAYQPAWQGGLLWDDQAHVTRPDLRSWQGLCRIWFEPKATQQYYPSCTRPFGSSTSCGATRRWATTW